MACTKMYPTTKYAGTTSIAYINASTMFCDANIVRTLNGNVINDLITPSACEIVPSIPTSGALFGNGSATFAYNARFKKMKINAYVVRTLYMFILYISAC